MRCKSWLVVVEGADHGLKWSAGKTEAKQQWNNRAHNFISILSVSLLSGELKNLDNRECCLVIDPETKELLQSDWEYAFDLGKNESVGDGEDTAIAAKVESPRRKQPSTKEKSVPSKDEEENEAVTVEVEAPRKRKHLTKAKKNKVETEMTKVNPESQRRRRSSRLQRK